LRGVPNPTRQRPDEVLVLRAPTQNREKPARLRRALREIGRPYRCAACSVGDNYNGRPLVLHVDHIDGQLWDCRPDNVRFLCPNCHSQTPTYAGRKSRQGPEAPVRIDDQGNPSESPTRRDPLNEDQILEVLSRVTRKEISPSQAARLIGCARAKVYRLQRRLVESGSITVTRRPPTSPANSEAVLGLALANPGWGPRKIAAALSRLRPAPITVTERTVGNILARAGLSTRDARAAAAGNGAQPFTV
jgi:5-methylcytosine-specific restriction endonuclease McrA